jgi:hypothetical protein
LVGLDDEERFFDSRVGAAFSISGDGDHAAFGFEDGQGEVAGLAAYGVEDYVDVADEVLKAGGFVVDDLVGAELFDEIEGWGGGSGDDVGSVVVGELDGKDADGSGASVDEDALLRLELGVVEEALPCGEGSDGDGGGFGVGEGGGFRRDAGGDGEAELGGGSFGEPVVHAIDGLAESEAGDVFAEGYDGAGELVAGDGVFAFGSGFGVGCGIPIEFGGGDAGCVDLNQDLCFAECGLRDSAEVEGDAFRGLVELHCFHMSPICTGRELGCGGEISRFSGRSSHAELKNRQRRNTDSRHLCCSRRDCEQHRSR